MWDWDGNGHHRHRRHTSIVQHRLRYRLRWRSMLIGYMAKAKITDADIDEFIEIFLSR